MRNLKRVLSLALAVVMVVGLMIVGASAASIEDFGDKAEITQNEAVSLMVDLGILEGANDGKFYPKATLDRQALAKITFLVATGQTSWNVYDTASCELTDVDVPGVWAKGAIKYCVTAGYISGNPDKTYSPNGKLETVAVAKTLLCALGFDAAKEGYVNNPAWDINIMDRAREMGLLEGLSSTLTHGLISREDACRMAYNAMFAKVRTPNKTYYPTMDGKVTEIITGYEEKNYTLGYKNYNLIKVTGTVKNDGTLDLTDFTTNPATAAASATTVGTQLGIGTTFDNALAVDQVGMSVSAYIQANATLNAAGEITALAGAKTISKAPVVGKANVIATYYGGKTWANVIDKDNKDNFVCQIDTGANFISNGVSAGTSAPANIDKKGVVVEFIDTDSDGKAEIVKVTEKSVAKLTADPTVTKQGDKTLVTVPGVAGVVNADSAKVKGYEGLKKDDVVLYVNLDGVTTIEKAEKVTGKVAGVHSAKGSLIDGKFYVTTGLTVAPAATIPNNGKTYNFFLDNGGNVVMSVEVKGEGPQAPEKETGNLVLTDVALVKKQGDGSFGSESGVAIQAKIVKPDGTQQTVWIDSVDGITVLPKTGTVADLPGANGATATVKSGTTKGTYGTAMSDKTKEVAAGTFYEVTVTPASGTPSSKVYLVADDKANLTGLTTVDAIYSYTVEKDDHLTVKTVSPTAISGKTITTGNATLDAGLFGNAETVFLIKGRSGNTTTYTPYTGIANVPTSTANSASGSAVAKDGVASFVYLTAFVEDNSDADQGDRIYILANDDFMTTTSGRDTWYTLTALLNGEKKEIKISNKPSGNEDSSKDLTVGALYPATVNDKDVYTLGDTAETAVDGIKANAGGVIVVGTGTAYTYAADATAFVIENGSATKVLVKDLAVDANDKVVVLDTRGDVDVIYVTKESNAPTVAIATATDNTNSLTVDADKKEAVGDTGKKLDLTVTAATGTTVKSVNLDGGADIKGSLTNIVISAHGTHTVVVTVEDNNSKAETVVVYTFTTKAS